MSFEPSREQAEAGDAAALNAEAADIQIVTKLVVGLPMRNGP